MPWRTSSQICVSASRRASGSTFVVSGVAASPRAAWIALLTASMASRRQAGALLPVVALGVDQCGEAVDVDEGEVAAGAFEVVDEGIKRRCIRLRVIQLRQQFGPSGDEALQQPPDRLRTSPPIRAVRASTLTPGMAGRASSGAAGTGVWDSGRNRARVACSRATSMGLVRRPCMLTASVRCRSCSMTAALRAMIGTSVSRARIAAVASKPSMTGICRSIKIRSKRCVLTCSTASCPSLAMETARPKWRRLSVATIRFVSLSSTSKTSPCRVRRVVRCGSARCGRPEHRGSSRR